MQPYTIHRYAPYLIHLFTSIASDKERIEESIEEFNKLLQHSSLIYVPFCILANKQDRTESLGIPDIEEVGNYHRKYN
jgi:hypothetical protein